ncbi:MAG: nitrogen fixation protein NifH [Chloroflexi bacterium]|nr:nitrogen fixation protein NifH [Chloroflexota bacterium]
MNQVLNWLLEKENASVRYFTLRYLLDQSENEREVRAARRAIMASEPVRAILAAQQPDGYWVKPGSGYSPKYQSTVWQILFLAELGADRKNSQVRRGCEYLLTHAPAVHGGFSAYQNATPSGAIHCLNGNLVWALVALGYAEDDRVQRAVEWLAGAITGDNFDWFYASGTSGPNFQCAANQGQPCAWGAVKALHALANLPRQMQSARVRKATRMAADFLLSRDLAKADYPYTIRVSGEWFKFGFPLSYTSDVLEALLALTDAGYSRDPRLQRALELVRSKREPDGRWKLKHTLNGKMWADIEAKGQPSKWVTLRAMRVLKQSDS